MITKVLYILIVSISLEIFFNFTSTLAAESDSDGLERCEEYQDQSLNTSISSDAEERKRLHENNDGISRKKLKYRDKIGSISGKVPSYLVELVTKWEKILDSSTDTNLYYWDFTEISEDTGVQICNEVWTALDILPPRSLLINDMKADCDFNKVVGPSGSGIGGKHYKGYFYYINKEKNIPFYADLVRCNCAYISENQLEKKRTVRNSKAFFFLYTMDHPIYYVLTFHPEFKKKDNVLRIVNIVEI